MGSNLNKKTKVIAVTGGKGGVGKTTVAVNLSIVLSQLGQKVLLMDADMGLANVDVLLGLKKKHDLSDVLYGDYQLDDIIIKGPADISIVPASSGVQKMAELSYGEVSAIISYITDLSEKPDYLIIDCAAGISDSVLALSSAADDLILVVCNEPSSITDAYAYMKLMNNDFGHNKFRVLANMVATKEASQTVFAKLTKVADRFLDVSLDFLGMVPYDRFLSKAILKQRAVVDIYPSSKSGQAFMGLGQKVMKWPENKMSGRVAFYLDQVAQ